MLKKICDISIIDIEDTSLVPKPFCSSLNLSVIRLNKVGSCPVFSIESDTVSLVMFQKDCTDSGDNCGCVSQFRFINSFGVQDVFITKCPKESKIDIESSTYDVCSCDYGGSIKRVYRRSATKTISVLTLEIGDSQQEKHVQDFLISANKEMLYRDYDDDGNVIFEKWKPVALVGDTYNRLENSSDKYRLELEFVFLDNIKAVI